MRISTNAAKYAFLLCLCAVSAQAQIRVGAGSVLALGGGTLGAGCADVSIAGSLAVGAGTLDAARNIAIAPGGLLGSDAGAIRLSGDWSQLGTFSAGSGSVAIVDGCAASTSTFAGASALHAFSADTTLGHALIFPPTLTQSVGTALALSGASGHLLAIRSTTPGQAGLLSLAAADSQTITYVDVEDNHATGQPLAPGAPAAYQSVDSGNSQGWFEKAVVTSTGTVPAPLLTPSLLTGLALLLALLGAARGCPRGNMRIPCRWLISLLPNRSRNQRHALPLLRRQALNPFFSNVQDG